MNRMIVIDATDLVLGRMAAYAAKQALLGETISIVNAEKAVITGRPEMVLAQQKRKRDMGAPLIGPYYPRMPERIVKRTIRGMLSHKNPRGKDALARIKCYCGVPDALRNEKAQTFEHMNVHKKHVKYVSIAEISRHFGAKMQ
jgi:large subunit ribosomal protein L13